MVQSQESIDLNCPHCNTKIASILHNGDNPKIESFSSFVLLFPDTDHKTYRFICGNCGEISPTASDIWTKFRH